MKKVRALSISITILAIGFGAGLNFLGHAQSALQSLQSTVACMQAQAAAEPVADKIVPEISWNGSPGTYWSLQLTNQPPLPFCPFSVQVVEVTNDFFVFDDRNVDYPGLGAQQAEVANNLTMDNGETGFSLMEADEGGFFPAFSFSSDQLWLEITGVSNNQVLSYLVIHTAEANGQYDLFLTTNLSCNVPGLSGTNWQWVLRCNPGQTNLTVTNVLAAQCFFRLGRTNDTDGDGLSDAFEQLTSHTEPNNGDQNANGIPDGWEWSNFGNLNQPPGSDYDDDGLSDFQEYQRGSDPNTISFEVGFENYNVNSDITVGTFLIFAGVPAKMAVLVGNTNFAAAAWISYSPTVPINLVSSDGPKIVWIGLKGQANSSQASWERFPLVMDKTPPSIVVTNPTAATVSQALIQLQGYCPEPLSRLRFDITNAAGSLIDLQGGVVEQWFDTNLFDLTTNWFQCYDIWLTNGVNTIVLRATDQAGNVSTNVYTYILDYSIATNPPALKLLWPRDRFQIAGDRFDWRAWVDDPTAKVSGWIVTTNGMTNTFSGKVERNGNIWAENLPLFSGTNILFLAVTNGAGHGCLTNISVLKNDLVLTMNPVTDDLWQQTVNVSGYIGDASYSVWVNGVKAVVNPDGSWNATGVPVTEGGVAIFDIAGYAPGEKQPPVLEP